MLNRELVCLIASYMDKGEEWIITTACREVKVPYSEKLYDNFFRAGILPWTVVQELRKAKEILEKKYGI